MAKHPGGRPTDYRSEYCEQLIAHMSTGLSFASFGGVIGVAESTLHKWKEDHPEWAEAEELGKAKSMLFWENLGIVGTVEGKNFNARSWIYNMANRFKWRDRQDVTSDDKELKTPTVFIPKESDG